MIEKYFGPLVGILFLACTSMAIHGQQRNPQLLETTQEVRVRKIVSELEGVEISLETKDKLIITGHLEGVSAGAFNLTRNGRLEVIPIDSVSRIMIRPGASEIFLTAISAGMGALFLGGALVLSTDDVSENSLGLTALLGLTGGALWGYSTFYNCEIIELE